MSTIVAGIDTGLCDARILVRQLVSVGAEERAWKVLLEGDVSPTILGDLIDALKVSACVIDAFPQQVTAIELQRRFPGVVWLCHHINESNMPPGEKARWDETTGIVYAVNWGNMSEVQLHAWLAGDKAVPFTDEEEG